MSAEPNFTWLKAGVGRQIGSCAWSCECRPTLAHLPEHIRKLYQSVQRVDPTSDRRSG